MNNRLETVLITGGSRGIGAAAARWLASPRRHLVLVARGEPDLQERCREIQAMGGMATPLVADLGDPAALRNCITHVERTIGTPDGMVLNAAVSNNLAFQESSPTLLEQELRINYIAPAEILLHFLPLMAERGSGRAVVVGSLTSIVPFPGNASYSASKAALATLVRGLRMEYQGRGIAFGIVLPGYTETQMTATLSSNLVPMSADRVGRSVAECYEQADTQVVPGAVNRAAALLFSLFPQTADRFLGRFSRYLVPSAT